MQPTKEFIELCKMAHAVQLTHVSKVGDLVTDPDDSPILIEKHQHLKWKYFLPDASWCAERFKISYEGANYRPLQDDWIIGVREFGTGHKSEYFTHADYDTVHLIAAEYVLSGGKNDLRKEI